MVPTKDYTETKELTRAEFANYLRKTDRWGLVSRGVSRRLSRRRRRLLKSSQAIGGGGG